jgi:hypothetical protein
VSHTKMNGTHNHAHDSADRPGDDFGQHGHVHSHHGGDVGSEHTGHDHDDYDGVESYYNPPGPATGVDARARSRMPSPASAALMPAERSAINHTIVARNEASR